MGTGLAMKSGNADGAKVPTAIQIVACRIDHTQWWVLDVGYCATYGWVHPHLKIAEEPDAGKSACPVL
jgi:hypothetical protein